VNEIVYEATFGSLRFGLSQAYHSSLGGLSASIESIGVLTIELNATQTVTEAVRLVHKIESLFSLLCFSYIKAQKLEVEVLLGGDVGQSALQRCTVERALLIERAKTEVEQHEIPFRLNNLDVGLLVDNFVKLFDRVDQTLNWYRIVIAEHRYVEDNYFYSVRMVESLYKSLEIETHKDNDALDIVDKLFARLTEPTDCELVKFIKRRVVPIFNKPWSLSEVIRDLKSRYSAMIVTGLLDEKIITRLRAKEAHGVSQSYTGQEYEFMIFAYELLTILYTLVVLEHCGVERAVWLESLRGAPKWSSKFSKGLYDRLAKEFAN
jgi:hypothetical protein